MRSDWARDNCSLTSPYNLWSDVGEIWEVGMAVSSLNNLMIWLRISGTYDGGAGRRVKSSPGMRLPYGLLAVGARHFLEFNIPMSIVSSMLEPVRSDSVASTGE